VPKTKAARARFVARCARANSREKLMTERDFGSSSTTAAVMTRGNGIDAAHSAVVAVVDGERISGAGRSFRSVFRSTGLCPDRLPVVFLFRPPKRAWV
jgi:hypothetical protein